MSRKADMLHFLAKMLNRGFHLTEAEVVDDHIEVKLDGNIVKITITITKDKK